MRQVYAGRSKAFHLEARINVADYSIVIQYQAEYRGFVQYYVLAFNAHRLWQVHCVMQLSQVFTLADKHRTSAAKIFRKYRRRCQRPTAPSGCWKPDTHGVAGKKHW
jgi:hypothetical protein